MITFSRLGKPFTVALAVLVATVGVSAPTALATPRPATPRLATAPAPLSTLTWTVTPGGSVTGKSGEATLTDTVTGTAITCKSMTLAGSLKSGSGLPGNGLGVFTKTASTGCSFAGIPVTVSTSSPHWMLNALSYRPGVTTGTLTGIHFTIKGDSCSFVLDGTSATADNGHVRITFSNAHSHLTTLTAGSSLNSYNVSGCSGLTANGNPWTFDPCYILLPPQTITGSPPVIRPAMTGPPC
jgi:hypothetical protein